MILCSKILLIFGLFGFVGVGLGDVPAFLGRGMFIPATDLMGTINEQGYGTAEIFEPFSDSCFHETPVYQSSRYFTFYENTASFYSSITTSTGISAKFQSDFSLVTTLQTQSSSISGSSKTITGNSLVIAAKSKSFALDKTCLVDEPPFTKNFIKDVCFLRTKISSPWLKSTWNEYDAFLRKYGSHVITEITTGSEIDQRSFSQEWHSYSERDFEVKSCVGLAAPGGATQMGVSQCANITNEEIERVRGLEMNTKLTVNGGTSETRDKLLEVRTRELIEQFMMESKETDAPIRYKLTPIWDIIKQRHIGMSDDFIRGVNMESYYLGYLNYGCAYDYTMYSDNQIDMELQKFDFTLFSTPESPQYECTLAASGCNDDDDCIYRPIWCSCEGSSCVMYKDVKLNTDKVKKIAKINRDKWGWAGCHLSGLHCTCPSANVRTRVWPADVSHADLAYTAHNRMVNSAAKRNKNKDEKEEL